METRTQDPAGYYVWEVPGQSVVVHLRLDVVDRLAAEVMRGFGSVPKRGAEIGGFLIGTIRPGVPAIVRINDFESIACEYRRGPSYLFTEEDGVAVEDSWERLQPSVSPSAYAVGYFRSHTRDGFSLAPEDLELLDRFLPGPAHVALLIKPYATKASVGGFFVRAGHTLAGRACTVAAMWRHGVVSTRLPPVVVAALARVLGLPAGSAPTLALECDDVALLRAVALSTDVVLAVSYASVQSDLDAGTLVPLTVDGVPPLFAEMGVVSLRRRTLSPMARRAVDVIARVAMAINRDPAEASPRARRRRH